MEERLGDKVNAAVKALIEKGLLIPLSSKSELSPGGTQRATKALGAGRKHGKQSQVLRKRSLIDLENDRKATSERKRLKVALCEFE